MRHLFLGHAFQRQTVSIFGCSYLASMGSRNLSQQQVTFTFFSLVKKCRRRHRGRISCAWRQLQMWIIITDLRDYFCSFKKSAKKWSNIYWKVRILEAAMGPLKTSCAISLTRWLAETLSSSWDYLLTAPLLVTWDFLMAIEQSIFYHRCAFKADLCWN